MNGALKVQLDDFAYEPKRAHASDAGLDLRTPKAFSLDGGDSTVVDTGVHVDIPDGWFGKLESKSGLNINHNVYCTGGVIDAGYSGSIKVRVKNDGFYPYRFDAGDKIVQLVVIPCAALPVEIVDEVSGGERGNKGFGSSGR